MGCSDFKKKFQEMKGWTQTTDEREAFSKIPYGTELALEYLNWDPNERLTCEYSLDYIKIHHK